MKFLAGFACGIVLMAATCWTYTRFGFYIDEYLDQRVYPSTFREGPRVYRRTYPGADIPVPTFEEVVPSAKRVKTN